MVKNIAAVVIAAALVACGGQSSTPAPGAHESAPAAPVHDPIPPLDPNNIVSIAQHSPDHTTLVSALVAADYVYGVANPGPLTVFAPTNAAFAALPAGTVDNLMKPENVGQLRHVLQHHVLPSSYEANALHDGQVLGMVDGHNETVHISADGHIKIGDANVLSSVRASNGVVHIIDKVLVPPTM